MVEIKSIFNFSCKDVNGKKINLSNYSGKVILIVNTASKCGFTPQYKGLQELYKNYSNQDFEILGLNIEEVFDLAEKKQLNALKDFVEVLEGTI